MICKLEVVVNLTIERKPIPLIWVGHRLVTGGADVENRETAVAQSGVRRGIEAFAIRAAMPLQRDHLADRG